jgi:hypothetical protein
MAGEYRWDAHEAKHLCLIAFPLIFYCRVCARGGGGGREAELVLRRQLGITGERMVMPYIVVKIVSFQCYFGSFACFGN